MKKRQLIIVGVAIAILLGSKLGMDAISGTADRKKVPQKAQVVTVFAEAVSLEDQPIVIATTGALRARERVELFSEVQGMMLPDNGMFRAGNSFQKGQRLLQIRDDDARAAVIAQRSAFERIVTSVMADIRLDFPESYDQWLTYLRSIDVNKVLPELPSMADAKLKSYLTGRDIFTTYYGVRNAEIALSRYTIHAPFTGTLTAAHVDPGTVIRPGQLLGVFIRPGTYELQAAVDSRSAHWVRKGQRVELIRNSGEQRSYTGVVTRVNPSIDPKTQMSAFFVELTGSDLSEGEFLTARLHVESVRDAYEMDRSALKNSNTAFVVEEGKLRGVEVEIVHQTERTTIVKGLTNGQRVLTKLPPAVFDGMQVKVYAEATAE